MLPPAKPAVVGVHIRFERLPRNSCEWTTPDRQPWCNPPGTIVAFFLPDSKNRELRTRNREETGSPLDLRRLGSLRGVV